MTVRTIKRKIDETRDGIQSIENDLLHESLGFRFDAIVTFELVQHIDDVDSGGSPVIKAVATEPIQSEQALAQLKELQASAFQVRTGQNALELPDVEGEAGE